MPNNTFFNANLIVTNSDGEYYGVRQFMRLIANKNFIQLGSIKVPYNKLLKISSEGNRIYLQYISKNGKTEEYYLKYNTFFWTTAPKRLSFLANKVKPLISTNNGSNYKKAIQAQFLADKGKDKVIIYSSKVSFPIYCPTCLMPASNVTKLDVTSFIATTDFLKLGYWLIPVCHLHKDLNFKVKVVNWSPKNSEVTFSFANIEYAEAFLKINQMPLHQRQPVDPSIVKKVNQIKQNFKFVLFEYYISAIFFSFLNSSDIQELKINESVFFRGFKYNAITLIAGWWSFPFGPFYTLIVLLKNIIGGVEVTDKVIKVLNGQPMSAVEE